MQTHHRRFPPQGGAAQSVWSMLHWYTTHLPVVGGGVGEEGHVGGELAPEPENPNKTNKQMKRMNHRVGNVKLLSMLRAMLATALATDQLSVWLYENTVTKPLQIATVGRF